MERERVWKTKYVRTRPHRCYNLEPRGVEEGKEDEVWWFVCLFVISLRIEQAS